MWSTVSSFKTEHGISLKTLQWERASSRIEGRIPWFSLRLGRKFGVSLELRRLLLPQGSQVSFRVVTGTSVFLASHFRGNRPHLGLCPETPCSSPVVTGILGLHLRFTWGVRPRLEWKQRTPLSSQVEMGISWSPLSGLKGITPPVEF